MSYLRPLIVTATLAMPFLAGRRSGTPLLFVEQHFDSADRGVETRRNDLVGFLQAADFGTRGIKLTGRTALSADLFRARLDGALKPLHRHFQTGFGVAHIGG
jgi:hypothetical protein